MANNFEFYAPTKVIFGKGAENETGKQRRALGAPWVVIVNRGGRVRR